ncbi:VapE domain-containing protein [Nodularia spumigena]|uniref:VapE domain-containing protein n=1 Tax=Nodularia spumigena TaxID=70799 RepID=UPI00232AC867|nr:VapE domain-containing protein [Nodularia spumigena]MDB9349025.1 VapE family protein [Nodularia spumigena CS-588/01]MDB9352481.1 VapE family protein [Nodularia spumigena CS-588/05]
MVKSNNSVAPQELEELDQVISSAHFEEWRLSAVSDEIIRLNLRTITDPRELDKILWRNTKRRWKHSDNLVPSWVASGIDPLTAEATLQGVQVKPDTPPLDKNGKIQKYLSASGMESAPLFLRTGEPYYWQQILNRPSDRIIITEGAKKAAAGLSAGYPTISIPGVSTCRKNGRLHPMLEAFAVLGRTFYLCFDNDILVKRPVQLALIGLAAKLAKNGSNIMIIEIPPGPAKGMDDFISANGRESFEKLIDDASTFEEWKSNLDESDLDEEKPKSKIARNFEMIQEAWGESLRYNSLKKDIEFNGMPLNAEYLRLMVGLQFPVDISKDDAFTIVEFLAKKNSYSPVEEYLDEVEAKFPDIDAGFLDNLAKEFFGTDDPLHAKYFKNFLVASVARARVPGCWMDCALLLVGKQGIRKSTFWRTLYGDDFFSDDLGDGSDKDERMKMHRFWCLEWSEFETVYKRKDINQLKAFLARRHETFRTPYDRLPKDYKRSCVFAGTTNENEILNDPTGNRRFWIIPCSGIIPVDDVQKMRDRIWAAANALFKSGYPYRLDEKEELSREEQNEEYQVSHPWSDILDEYVKYKEYVTIQDCFKQLSIDPVHQNPSNQRQIINLLKKSGLENDRVRIDGRWVRIWRNKSDVLENDLSAGSAGSSENGRAETLVQKEIQPIPVENTPPDQVRTNTQPNIDPLEEKKVITVSQAPSKDCSHFDPADPAIHRENIPQEKTASELQPSTGVVHPTETASKDKLACPPLDSYYSEFNVKPMRLTVNVGYGDIKFVATPYKKMSTSTRIHFLVDFPDGEKCAFTKKMTRTKDIDLKVEVKRHSSVIDWHSKQWHLWQSKIGQKLEVRRLNSDIHSDIGYFSEMATLISVPSYPLSEDFVFQSDTGEKFPGKLEDIK